MPSFWFDHLEEGFSYKKCSSKCFALKTSCLVPENINETPVIAQWMLSKNIMGACWLHVTLCFAGILKCNTVKRS